MKRFKAQHASELRELAALRRSLLLPKVAAAVSVENRIVSATTRCRPEAPSQDAHQASLSSSHSEFGVALTPLRKPAVEQSLNTTAESGSSSPSAGTEALLDECLLVSEREIHSPLEQVASREREKSRNANMPFLSVASLRCVDMVCSHSGLLHLSSEHANRTQPVQVDSCIETELSAEELNRAFLSLDSLSRDNVRLQSELNKLESIRISMSEELLRQQSQHRTAVAALESQLVLSEQRGTELLTKARTEFLESLARSRVDSDTWSRTVEAWRSSHALSRELAQKRIAGLEQKCTELSRLLGRAREDSDRDSERLQAAVSTLETKLLQAGSNLRAFTAAFGLVSACLLYSHDCATRLAQSRRLAEASQKSHIRDTKEQLGRLFLSATARLEDFGHMALKRLGGLEQRLDDCAGKLERLDKCRVFEPDKASLVVLSDLGRKGESAVLPTLLRRLQLASIHATSSEAVWFRAIADKLLTEYRGLDSERTGVRNELQGAKAENARLVTELRGLENRLKAELSQNRSAKREMAKMQSAIQASMRSLEERDAESKRLALALADATAELSASQETIQALMENVSTLSRQSGEHREIIDGCAEQIQDQEAEIVRLRREVADLSTAAADLRQEKDELLERLEFYKAELGRAEACTRSLLEQLQGSNETLAVLTQQREVCPEIFDGQANPQVSTKEAGSQTDHSGSMISSHLDPRLDQSIPAMQLRLSAYKSEIEALESSNDILKESLSAMTSRASLAENQLRNLRLRDEGPDIKIPPSDERDLARRLNMANEALEEERQAHSLTRGQLNSSRDKIRELEENLAAARAAVDAEKRRFSRLLLVRQHTSEDGTPP